MNPSCHPSHVASQAKAEKTPCHKHAQALSLTHTQTCTTPTHMCTHAPVRIRVCVRTRVHRRVPTHRYSPAHIHTCTHTHTPCTRAQGHRGRSHSRQPGLGRQADLGPCPRSRPHWPSLCQARPGGQDPWRVGGPVGERGGTRPGWRLCLWDTVPPPPDPHVGAPAWVVVQPPGRPLFPSHVSSRRTASPSPPGRGPPPPRQHRPSHSPALSTTSPCPVGPRAPHPIPNPVPPLGLAPGGPPGSCLCVCGRPSPGMETPGSSVGPVTIE